MVADLIAGTLRTEGGFSFPDACGRIASVWLGGGSERRQACAARLPVPATVSAHGVFAGVTGGQALLDGHAGLVVDLGQTSAKGAGDGLTSWRVMRQGRGWQAVLHEVLRGMVPERLVLGLPSELNADGAGPCSYFEALSWDELQAHVPCDTVVVSDAELAGCAARQEGAAGASCENAAHPCLALTLGHGVGAALVWP